MLPHSTVVHRNVTALWCHMIVKLILTWTMVKLRWLVTQNNRYIGTAMQLRCSMNGPLEPWRHQVCSNIKREIFLHQNQKRVFRVNNLSQLSLRRYSQFTTETIGYDGVDWRNMVRQDFELTTMHLSSKSTLLVVKYEKWKWKNYWSIDIDIFE